MQSCGARGVIAALTGNDVIGVFARDEADEQRLEDALFADGVGEFADIADRLARLIGIGANFLDGNHAADRRAAVAG